VYLKWPPDPVSRRDCDNAHPIHVAIDVHSDNLALGFRFIADEPKEWSLSCSENWPWRFCS